MLVDILSQGQDGAVRQADAVDISEVAPQVRQWPVGEVLEILRFRPRHRLTALEDQDGVGCPVGEVVRDLQSLFALERRTFADEDLANRVKRRHHRRLPPRQRVEFRHPGQELDVVQAVPRLVEVELVVEVRLLDERQDRDAPTQEWLSVDAAHGGGRQPAVHLLGGVERKAQLLEASLHSFGRFPDILHGHHQGIAEGRQDDEGDTPGE